jgi:hypothetical protein
MDKSDAAAAAASNTANSYTSGLRDKLDDLYLMGRRMGNAVTAGYNDATQSHSPSKVAIESAEDTVDGYLIGYENRIKNMGDSGSRLALATNDAYVNTMKQVTLNAAPVIYDLSDVSQRQTAGVSIGELLVNVDATGMTVRSDKDIDKITDELSKKISKELADELQRKIAAKGRKTA